MGVIGYLVWWEIHNSRISSAELNELFLKHGVDMCVTDTTYTSRFKEAVRYFNLNMHIGKKYLLTLIRSAKNHIVYGLMEADVIEEETFAEYAQIATITFWIESGILDCAPMHDQFIPLRDHYLNTSGNIGDIRLRASILQDLRKCFYLGVRSHSGVYWILPSDFKRVERIKRVLADVPGENVYMVAPLANSSLIKDSFKSKILKLVEDKLLNLRTSFNLEMVHKQVIIHHGYLFMDNSKIILEYFKEIQAMYEYPIQEYIDEIEDMRTEIGNRLYVLLPSPD